jgi:hypothetical protein
MSSTGPTAWLASVIFTTRIRLAAVLSVNLFVYQLGINTGHELCFGLSRSEKGRKDPGQIKSLSVT